MLDILLQVMDRCAHLDLVLPVILSPLFLEFKLRAVSRHQSIDEVDLDFIDVDDIWYVTTGRIVGEVAVDGAIVRGAYLE